MQSHRRGCIASARDDGISLVRGGCNTPLTKEIEQTNGSIIPYTLSKILRVKNKFNSVGGITFFPIFVPGLKNKNE